MILDAWQYHQPEPFYNQLKQLSESPDITPKKIFSRPQLSLKNSQISTKQQQNLNKNNRNYSFSLQHTYIRPIKLKRESIQLNQQIYSFDNLNISQNKKQTNKIQDSSNRQYKVSIKDQTKLLTKRNPLRYLSKLLLKLDKI